MPTKIKETKSQPQPPERDVERNLFVWMAPSRPFKRRDREFWVTVISIGSIAGLVLFLVEGVMPVMLIISLIFLFYILTTVEPEKLEYKITNKGVKIGTSRTDWIDIKRFWFTRRFDCQLLILDINAIPGRMELVVEKKDIEKLRGILSKYLLEEEAPPSGLDKMAEWFGKKLPGNK